MQLQDALISSLAAMLLHEMAHVAVALALKVKVHQVGMNWSGPYIRRECGTAKQNLAITLAGPGVNLWLALLFHRISPNFALCNLIIGITNLLPISASDGSRALRLIKIPLASMEPRIGRTNSRPDTFPTVRVLTRP
jgi:Zn-dependent protease